MKTDRIKLLLAVSIALTVMSGVITFYAIKESRGRLDWVLHSYKVINQGNEVFSRFTALESGQHGFLLTGDSSYLETFRESESTLPIALDSLANLIRDNSNQSSYLSRSILPLIARTQIQMEKDLEFSSVARGLKDQKFTEKLKSKVQIDSLRSMMAHFNETEVSLLTERLGKMNNTLDQQNMLRYISFILISIVSVVAFISLGRKQKQNDELIKKLELTNVTLEQKVKDRTRELALQNQNIIELNEELRQNMEEMESFYDALHVKSIKTEDKLKEIRDLYENAPCGYHSLAEDGTIVHMNERELGWLGYKRDEVIGKMNVTKLLKPEEHQSYHDDFATFKKHGFIVNKEHTLVRKDGTFFHVLLNATAIYDKNGKYQMSRGSIIDVTHRKEAETKLVQANKDLIHLNEEKNHFLGIAAHDLRNPIQGILGLINLIMRQPGNLTSEQQEYLKYIQRSCLSMQTLIINLLDIHKIEQGINVISLQLVELDSLSRDMMALFQETAKSKNISLHVECNASEKKIMTDPNALTRILENLLSNAIKFSPKDRAVWLRITHNHTKVKFEVTDQGQGISKEDMPKLFRKFQKLQAIPTDKESSTGLGLSIVKELVHALHGKISVESEVNVGSRFSVELPVA